MNRNLEKKIFLILLEHLPVFEKDVFVCLFLNDQILLYPGCHNFVLFFCVSWLTFLPYIVKLFLCYPKTVWCTDSRSCLIQSKCCFFTFWYSFFHMNIDSEYFLHQGQCWSTVFSDIFLWCTENRKCERCHSTAQETYLAILPWKLQIESRSFHLAEDASCQDAKQTGLKTLLPAVTFILNQKKFS